MSGADIEAIARGLAGDADDRWFWRDKAERRLRALDEDEPIFGLAPSEIAERSKLRTLLATGAKP